MLYCLKDYGIETMGIESDPQEVDFAHKMGLNVFEEYIDINKENKKVNEILYESDVVSFLNVLEHVENPTSFVDYFYRHMHTGAVLVIEVPRYPSLAALANLTNTNIVCRHLTPPLHLQIFSEEAMAKIYSDKFEMLGKWGFGQGYTDMINDAMLNSNTEENQLYDEVMKISNEIQFVIDENGLADQMLFVAKKI